MFTGDMIASQLPDPLIHLEKHGSSEGWITTTQGNRGAEGRSVRARARQRADEGRHRNAALKDAEAKRAKIKELVAQGKSLEEIRTAVGDPPPAGRAAAAGVCQLHRRGVQRTHEQDVS